MRDKNHTSFAGDGTGLIYGPDGQVLFTADQPGIREHILTEPIVVGEDGFNDALKLSGCARFRLIVPGIDARRCKEDAMDINHSSDCEVLVGDLWSGQTYCSTIKGGSTNIRIEVARQHDHGHQTDYDFGNAVDGTTSRARTTGCKLHVATVDGSPVKVRVLHAHKPATENPSQRYDFNTWMAGWFGTVYPILQRIAALFGQKI